MVSGSSLPLFLGSGPSKTREERKAREVKREGRRERGRGRREGGKKKNERFFVEVQETVLSRDCDLMLPKLDVISYHNVYIFALL